jgi:uncharacterized repeat protein (TIGR03806 family)
MKMSSHINRTGKLGALFLSSILLSACGSSSEPVSGGESMSDNPAICTSASTDINWEALLTENCQNLSDYNLFLDASDPKGTTTNDKGIPFSLSTPLFTDYATKYRYVFVPDGEAANYSDNEVMDFPIGTVLAKTFSLPDNTADRDGAETIIETRLLINRESGWKALPYYWETTSDAKLSISAVSIDSSLIHDGETKDFTYVVPSAGQCTACHSIIPLESSGDTLSVFKPIGPKARFLNNNYAYESGTENQLTHWVDAGILTGAPADLSTIDTAATLSDTDVIADMSDNQLELAARSYLDINCAHCHRSKLSLAEGDYTGIAGSSGLHIEFNRDFDTSPETFGVCKSALAGGNTDYPLDVIPGYSEVSYLPYRMNTNLERHRMPALGRSTIHTEGVELVKAWIDSMPADTCGVDGL